MTAFTRENVLHALRARVEATAPYQITDPGHPDVGGIVPPATGIAEPGHVGTAAFIAASAFCALGGDTDPIVLARAVAGCDYLLHAQRESGLIDLRSVNYESPPDTAFAVQQLAAVLAIGRARGRDDAAWNGFVGRAEIFVRRAARGVATGGFHTPNHRWVIAGAVAQLAALFPDLAPDLAGPMNAYLAEGFDADAEGAYLERSVGVYDAVTNRSLLLVAAHWPDEAVRAAAFASVRANLDFNLHLLHADATAETGLSRRQDIGTRPVPLPLAAPYFDAGIALDEPRYLQAAATLWEADRRDDDGHRLVDILWLAHALLSHGEPLPDRAALPPLPDVYTRLYPRNGVWRVRRGPLSLTAFRGMTRIIGLTYGAAELVALSISLSYFGTGRFAADTLTAESAEGDTATLTYDGTPIPRRPGYDLPLGRPVPPEAWLSSLSEREYIPRPPASGELTVRALPDGCELRYRNTDGMDNISVQIALDFAPGGVWETGDTAVQPQPGQVLFLTSGYGTMRYGAHALTIGPGAGAHRIWDMRDSTPPTPGTTRVLLALLTPTDHTFTIRGVSGIAPLMNGNDRIG